MTLEPGDSALAESDAERDVDSEASADDASVTEEVAGPRARTRRRKSLSDKQLAILEVIQRAVQAHGYPPSMREIGDAVGLRSLSSVTHQLNQLELSGYLRRDSGKTRAIEILIDLPGTATENPADTAPPVGDAAMVPLVGHIAAGVPITADQQVEEVFPLPRQLVGKGELFMLRVSGESSRSSAITRAFSAKSSRSCAQSDHPRWPRALLRENLRVQAWERYKGM